VSDARAACEQLIVRYHRLIDVGIASEGASLFDADAVLEVAGATLRGREQIANVLGIRQQNTQRKTLHALAGFDFEAVAEDTAAANGTLMLFAGNGSPISRIPESLARYEAEFRRNQDTWQISKLAVSILPTIEAAG
jgi:hypothetical protein